MATPRTCAGSLLIGVLGPLTVSVDGRSVAITAARLRTVLVVLALSAGEPMSFDRLAAAVWGEDLPKHCRRALQVYVTRLRGLLGPDLIRSVPAGYVLAADPDQMDALRFARLLDAAALADDVEAERALLAQALELWRGEPFEGVRSAWLDGIEATRLVDRRLTALERRIELDLVTHRTDGLVVELQDLTVRFPLREWFWAQLMMALDLAGRRAEALETYQRLCRFLAGQYGIEPSHRVQEAHRRQVRGQVPGPTSGNRGMHSPVPRQLPAGTSYFVGRSGTLAQLDALLPGESDVAPTTVVISAIAGAAGVGKTALAVHWASRVADRFPDGQLCVDLRGFDPSSAPMRPGDVIRGFLDALGVSPHRIPADPLAQVALYRSRMTGRRMLVLLDNARDADQVRPLIPGADGCLVLVTSRNQLVGLAVDDPHVLNVDVLTDAEALGLLEARLGSERVAAERQAAEEIIERCARLPLALTIVAARAVAHPAFPLAALAGDLRDAYGRLDALNGGDSLTDMRAVFTWSYRALTPDAARLFRLLAVHPGPDASAPAVASLVGRPPEQVQPLLTELASIHLITERVAGRYGFHDLLRAYATELAAAHESTDERRAAVRRLLDHYLHTTHATAYLLNPHRDHPIAPTDPAPGVIPEQVGAHGPTLLAWLATEHAVLLAVVGLAVDTGLDEHAWQLAWTFGGYLARSGRWQEWAATQRAALGAAERMGDRSELARAHRGLARAYRQLGRLDDAHLHLCHALRLCEEVGDPTGLGLTHTLLGQLLEMQEQLQAALAHSHQALDLFRGADDLTGTALALNAAGWCHARLGAYERALSMCTEALDLQRRLGDRYGEATTLDSLGYAHHHVGDFQQAIICYQSSLDLRHAGGELYGEAHTLIRLGDTHHTLGDTTAAAQAWRRGVAILEELEHPDADQARARLRRVAHDGQRRHAARVRRSAGVP